MKELERTKRISISGILIIGLLFIGFLGFKMPDNVFKKTKGEMLSTVVKKEYFIDKSEAFSKDFIATSILIDIRDEFDFNKGHFDGAINMPTSHLLVEDNIELIENFSEEGKSIVLYGSTPEEANAAWMLLYQLDIPKLRILSQRVYVENNKFISKPYQLEKGRDYTAAMKKATGIAMPDRIAKEVKEKVYVPVYIKVYEEVKTSPQTAHSLNTTNTTTQPNTAVNSTTIPVKKKRRKLRRKKKKKKEGGC